VGARAARFALVLVVAAAGAAATAPSGVPATTARGAGLSSLEFGVLQELNRIRVDNGLAPLRLSRALTSAADQHSREMSADGYFQHTSYDGTAFWKRIGRWYPSSGFGYWSVGENLLWWSPTIDPADALQLWMNSPEHRANIMAPRWREIGISAVHVSTAPGTYHGLPVTVITTDFGVRR